MSMTERQVLDCVLPKLEGWLIREHDVQGVMSWREKVASDGRRADGLVVGMFDDGETLTVSVEAKSRTTIHQLVSEYKRGNHVLEAVGVGLFAAAFNPIAGLIAFGADLILRRTAHTQSDAASQCIGYPGDLKILAVPDDVFNDYPAVRKDLRRLCEHLGLGLVRARPDGTMSWLCKPEEVDNDGWDDDEWLDQYLTADQMRWELRQYLDESSSV